MFEEGTCFVLDNGTCLPLPGELNDFIDDGTSCCCVFMNTLFFGFMLPDDCRGLPLAGCPEFINSICTLLGSNFGSVRISN